MLALQACVFFTKPNSTGGVKKVDRIGSQASTLTVALLCCWWRGKDCERVTGTRAVVWECPSCLLAVFEKPQSTWYFSMNVGHVLIDVLFS